MTLDRKSATNKMLGIENYIDRVHGDLLLSRITNKTLGVSEGNVRGRHSQ